LGKKKPPGGGAPPPRFRGAPPKPLKKKKNPPGGSPPPPPPAVFKFFIGKGPPNDFPVAPPPNKTRTTPVFPPPTGPHFFQFVPPQPAATAAAAELRNTNANFWMVFHFFAPPLKNSPAFNKIVAVFFDGASRANLQEDRFLEISYVSFRFHCWILTH